MSDLSNLPALPEPKRGPAPLLTPRKQAQFCEHLANHGNVRLACRAVQICPQTAYRARRASADFAACWDAAIVLARAHAEEVLADRALNGVEEQVFYHGEEVARRRRYDSRLLLAHLARLDALADAAAERAARGEGVGEQHFDAALDALERGEAVASPAVEAEPRASREGVFAPPGEEWAEGEGTELEAAELDAPPCPDWGEPCRACGAEAGADCGAWRFTREDLLDRADPANWVDGDYRDPYERELYARHAGDAGTAEDSSGAEDLSASTVCQV